MRISICHIANMTFRLVYLLVISLCRTKGYTKMDRQTDRHREIDSGDAMLSVLV